MNRICIIAHPRTGTNYLCDLLGRIPNFRSHTELFHNHAVFGLNDDEKSYLESKLGTEFSSIYDSSLIDFVHKNPAKFLKMIDEANENLFNVSSFKIFPFHLSQENIESSILSHDNTSYIFVKRRFIDAYISERKALVANAYTNVDTTDISVELNVSQYLSWAAKISEWFDFWEHNISRRGLRYCTIQYESELVGGVAFAMDNLSARLRELGLDVELHASNYASLVKQDQETDYRRKVSNWDDFSKQMLDLGFLPSA